MKLEITPRIKREQIAGNQAIDSLSSYGSVSEDAIKIKVVGISRQTLAASKTINDSTDVDVTDLIDGSVLQWNQATSKYQLVNHLGGEKITIAVSYYDDEVPTNLRAGEIGYGAAKSILYVGDRSGAPIAVGGVGAFAAVDHVHDDLTTHEAFIQLLDRVGRLETTVAEVEKTVVKHLSVHFVELSTNLMESQHSILKLHK